METLSSTQNEKLLIVDDQELDRAILVNLFESDYDTL